MEGAVMGRDLNEIHEDSIKYRDSQIKALKQVVSERDAEIEKLKLEIEKLKTVDKQKNY